MDWPSYKDEGFFNTFTKGVWLEGDWEIISQPSRESLYWYLKGPKGGGVRIRLGYPFGVRGKVVISLFI